MSLAVEPNSAPASRDADRRRRHGQGVTARVIRAWGREVAIKVSAERFCDRFERKCTSEPAGSASLSPSGVTSSSGLIVTISFSAAAAEMSEIKS